MRSYIFLIFIINVSHMRFPGIERIGFFNHTKVSRPNLLENIARLQPTRESKKIFHRETSFSSEPRNLFFFCVWPLTLSKTHHHKCKHAPKIRAIKKIKAPRGEYFGLRSLSFKGGDEYF